MRAEKKDSWMFLIQSEGCLSLLIIFSNQTEAKEVQREATMKALKPISLL